MISALETLQRIEEALNRPTDVLTLIDDLAPRSLSGALIWARRRPGWDEYRGQFPDQVIEIASVISRRALREFGLSFSDDGRLQGRFRASGGDSPRPTEVFRLIVQGEAIKVEYTLDYNPASGLALFAFNSPFEPKRPHPLSKTGHWSEFVRPEVVTACGGPRAYAQRFAEAKICGEVDTFLAVFAGTPQEITSSSAKRTKPEVPAQIPPVMGEHTAKVADERAPGSDDGPPTQRSLFS